LGHNAHLTAILAPAVPADPTAGIPGSPQTTRWSGDCEAYVDEDIADLIKGGMRVQLSSTIVDLPANLPVWPNEEDLMTLKRAGVIARYAPAAPQLENLVCRRIDGGLLMLGKLRVYAVRS
jgi:hypothetical protein